MKKAEKKFQQNIVNLSYNMGGKMLNILSLSSNCRKCERCIHRHGNGMKRKEMLKEINENGKIMSICKCCFAFSTTKFYHSLNQNLVENTNVLTVRKLTVEEYKAIAFEVFHACRKNGTDKFRLESFGDIQNVIHAENYLNICKAISEFCSENSYEIRIGLEKEKK